LGAVRGLAAAVIVIMSGPGGAGKGTVVSRLLELQPEWHLSRSWTTRPRRPGEPADAYTFVDRAAFEARRDAGGFLEWNKLSGTGHLYGTPTLEPDRDTLLEIEINGAQQVKARHPDAVLILLVPPSTEAQAERMRARGDDEASIDNRLRLGALEEEVGRRIADHVVVNDDVDRAAREVADILRGH
jgi:guanylate kinase